jgi:hypothetical protein
MRALDRLFGCLLFLGGIGHGIGSYKAYSSDHMTLLWAWSASLAVFLLAAVNLLRAGRNGDRGLAWISWFGRLIGNVLDPRPLGNMLITLVLAIFNLRTVMRSKA